MITSIVSQVKGYTRKPCIGGNQEVTGQSDRQVKVGGFFNRRKNELYLCVANFTGMITYIYYVG